MDRRNFLKKCGASLGVSSLLGIAGCSMSKYSDIQIYDPVGEYMESLKIEIDVNYKYQKITDEVKDACCLVSISTKDKDKSYRVELWRGYSKIREFHINKFNQKDSLEAKTDFLIKGVKGRIEYQHWAPFNRIECYTEIDGCTIKKTIPVDLKKNW